MVSWCDSAETSELWCQVADTTSALCRRSGAHAAANFMIQDILTIRAESWWQRSRAGQRWQSWTRDMMGPVTNSEEQWHGPRTCAVKRLQDVVLCIGPRRFLQIWASCLPRIETATIMVLTIFSGTVPQKQCQIKDAFKFLDNMWKYIDNIFWY